MVKLLKGLALFFVFSSTIVFLLEKKYSTYQNTYDIIFKDIDKDNDINTDIYIGNSHTMALDTFSNKSKARVLNLATPGQDLFKTYSILKKWIPLMKNVKHIYLGLDYETIGQNLSLSGLDYEDRQLYKYTDTLYKNSFENILMAKSNFFRSNRDIIYILGGKDFSGSKNFIPPVIQLNNEDCKKRALEHSQIRFKPELITENINLLESIIKLVADNHKKLILFNPPKTLCFVQNSVSKNVNFAKDKIYSAIKYNNIHYYDFYNDTSFNSSDFIDYDHLNNSGRMKLIKKINDKL